jgi:thioredoxin 1
MREITIDELKKSQSEGKKILVDFKARWCVPCKTLIPRLDTISNDYPNVEFVSIDVDDNMDAALDMGIRSVPTVIIYDGEKLVNRSQGAQPEGFYKDILNNL